MNRYNKYRYRRNNSNPPPRQEVNTPNPLEDCICNRKKTGVMCTICAYQFFGRVRIICPVHPQTIFLMDHDQCPQCLCRADSLREYPTDFPSCVMEHPMNN